MVKTLRLAALALTAVTAGQVCSGASSTTKARPPDGQAHDPRSSSRAPERTTQARAPSRTEPRAGAPAGPGPGSVEEICAAVRDLALPQPSASKAALESVRYGDAENQYYGFGVPVDYDKAFRTALFELQKARRDSMEGNTEILMMLYANGRGVPRDLDMAIKLACALEAAPAEREARVLHLHALRSGSDGRPFDICDDVTSTSMEGWCTERDGKLRAQEQERALSAMAQSWSESQRAALKRLRAAARAFWTARTANELDTQVFMGTAITHEEETLRNGLFEALQRFARGEIPHYTESEVVQADRELNRVYQALLKADFSDSVLRPRGIRATERAWLAYRDAWVKLGASRFPEVAASTWTTWATIQRTEQLASLLEEL